MKKVAHGYITLISLVVISSVAIAATLSIILLGVDASRSSLSVQQSAQARWIANACAEEALQKIREDSSLVGENDLNLGEGSCQYTVFDHGGESRSIEVVGKADSNFNKLKITVDTISLQIVTSFWKEMADF